MTTLDNGATIPAALTMTATYWEDAPRNSDWQRSADAWRITLTLDGREMAFPFYMGSGHNAEPPTLADVLESLTSDAASVENARDFEDWARDFGYDTDSRAAEHTYRACAALAERLRRVLGDSFAAVVFGPDAS